MPHKSGASTPTNPFGAVQATPKPRDVSRSSSPSPQRKRKSVESEPKPRSPQVSQPQQPPPPSPQQRVAQRRKINPLLAGYFASATKTVPTKSSLGNPLGIDSEEFDSNKYFQDMLKTNGIEALLKKDSDLRAGL